MRHSVADQGECRCAVGVQLLEQRTATADQVPMSQQEFFRWRRHKPCCVRHAGVFQNLGHTARRHDVAAIDIAGVLDGLQRRQPAARILETGTLMPSVAAPESSSVPGTFRTLSR